MVELDAELRDRYPADNVHSLSLDDTSAFEGKVFLAWLEGRPVGCGVLRALMPSVCELKGMYVRPESRGHGFGRRILSELERVAREGGFHAIRLETGTEQPESVALYESTGYRRIPCFGKYSADPYSLCYEKDLG